MRFKLGFAVAVLMFVVGCAQQHHGVPEAGAPDSQSLSRSQSEQQVDASKQSLSSPQLEQAGASKRLGTQWGEGLSSDVTTVDLQRISSQPVDVIEIHYSAARHMGNAIQEAMIANGRIGMSVLNENGNKWKLVKDGQRLYLRGREGERYQLFYRNYSQNTYEIVATVDGLDVLDGSAGSLSNRGYILYPNSTLKIEGFRKSQNEVAAFRFSAPRDSYAANTDAGSVRNAGVIGTAVFKLNNPRPVTSPRSGSQQTPQSFPGDNPGDSYAPPPNYRR